MGITGMLGLRLLVACVLCACAGGGVGHVAAKRELGGWTAGSRALVSLCGALAGACVGLAAEGLPEMVELLVLIVALLVCSVTDLGRRVIPNYAVAFPVVVRGVFLCLVAIGALGDDGVGAHVFVGVGEALAGGAAVLAVLAGTCLAWARVRGSPEGGIGGGDVKLLSACALYFGPMGGMACVALSCLLVLASCAGVWLACRTRSKEASFPCAFPLAPTIMSSVLILTAYRAL
ncbi:prepilin peptidase [Olsenella sp. Marseille-P4559]|uniref:prepilin peptidase n=1 Tax=Olsenella sp. Marseille-P4559 TaxID=2364795 RepID=UPI0013EF1F58|nr:prepilin peptidase [Olsenella sp. Marseille-P4559]